MRFCLLQICWPTAPWLHSCSSEHSPAEDVMLSIFIQAGCGQPSEGSGECYRRERHVAESRLASPASWQRGPPGVCQPRPGKPGNLARSPAASLPAPEDFASRFWQTPPDLFCQFAGLAGHPFPWQTSPGPFCQLAGLAGHPFPWQIPLGPSCQFAGLAGPRVLGKLRRVHLASLPALLRRDSRRPVCRLCGTRAISIISKTDQSQRRVWHHKH